MYDPAPMDTEFPLVSPAHDLLAATLRERNHEILEPIYIDRRCKNDTERLEKLFELYPKMTTQQASLQKATKPKTKGGK